jgi:hypothetical protein
MVGYRQVSCYVHAGNSAGRTGVYEVVEVYIGVEIIEEVEI